VNRSYVHGRVYVALANETILVFHRHKGKSNLSTLMSCIMRYHKDGTWNFNDFHSIVTGSSRASVLCLLNVNQMLWCGIANHIYVFDTQTLNIRVEIMSIICYVSIILLSMFYM
jgi:hypothetical protein